MVAATAVAEDVSLTAKVDKTTVKVGDPLAVTITLSGGAAGTELPAPEFPEGFAVMQRSQAANFSIQGGAIERSTSLTYVLVPQQAGTFKLGPFRVKHGGREVATEPLEVTVEPSRQPPLEAPKGGRITL
jgi:uncharacterized protein (DUF58 family)